MIKNILQRRMTNTDVAVAFIIKDNKILIGLRNYTKDVWKDISVWTVPGGRCNPKETLEETLRREVKEEVNIKNLDIQSYLGKVRGSKSEDVVHVFICKTNSEAKLMEPEKFSEWKWCDTNSVPDNFINPEGLDLVKKYLTDSG